MSSELARREAAELAAIPEWMRGDKDALALNIDFRKEDLVLPRLAICQEGTPQRKKGNDSYVKGLEEGDFFNTLSGQIYAKGASGEKLKFVVLQHWTENIYFGDGGTVKCRSREGRGCQLNNGGSCCNGGWREEGATMKDKKPLCTEFLNFVAFLPEHGEYVILSFKSTGLKVARQNLIAKLRMGQKGIADFAKVFELSAKYEEYAVGSAHQPVIRRGEMKAGDLTIGELITDKDTYDTLKKQAAILKGRTSAVKMHEDGLEREDAPGNAEILEGQASDNIPF
jgi:hypothetical protein